MVETPILYITFARPEYARQSFEVIKKIKPKKLYWYNNKAREDRLEEQENNEEIRSWLAEIDWNCELKIWFRDKYVDVYTSLWGAIDWLFENENAGIIIEEDVVASSAFFDFCDQLIPFYKDDDKVWMISGNNSRTQYNPQNVSYFFSRYPMIYGWATWKDRWIKMDRKMNFWPDFKSSINLKRYYPTTLSYIVQRYYFNQIYNKYEIYNPWDFIFICNMVKNGAYCVVPLFNLCADIGMSGVHIKNIKSEFKIDLTLDTKYRIDNFLTQVVPCDEFDRPFFFNYIFLKMIKRKLIKYFNINNG